MNEKYAQPPPYTPIGTPTSGPSAPTYHQPHLHEPPAPIYHQPAPTHSPSVVVVTTGSGPVRGCPACHNNSWTGTYPCLAWLCCIFCFPCGIICCCCMRKKKCSKCGLVIGQ